MCGVSHVSIQKIFYLLTKTKKLAKENTLFKFSAYFTKEKALAFSLKTQKQATTKGVGGLSFLPNWWTLIKESYMILAPAMLTIVWILLLNVLHVWYPLT